MNLDKIESAAKAATHGQWFPWHDVILVDAPGRGPTDFPSVASCVDDDNAEANARHIANMDPQTVLCLVAIARAAQRLVMAYDTLANKPVDQFTGEEMTECESADAALRDALEGVE